MTTPRIFLSKDVHKGEKHYLRGDDLRYVKSVLRLKTGARLLLFDGDGLEYEGVIERYVKEGVVVNVIDSINVEPYPIAVTLFQSLVKADVMDAVIEKATELGVEKIVPFSSIRSVVRLTPEKALSKRGRWQKIALEAARKFGRSTIPEVSDVASFEDILQMPHDDDVKLIFWEEEKRTMIKQLFERDDVRKAKSFAVIIGPEGGLEADEVDRAVCRGFTPVSLGRWVLKVDTAVMAALSIIQYEAGMFSGPEGINA